MKKLIVLLLVSAATFLPGFVLADGLSDATTEITAIQVWIYGILFIFSLIFMMYQVGMAMGDKKPWIDVLFAFGKVAAAGGCIAGATWAWSIWGT